MWYRLKLTLNTGTIQEYNPTHGGTDTLYTYTVKDGREFIGFHIRGASGGCYVNQLLVISRAAVCSISIDVSAINGQSQNVITGTTTSITFTATHMYCGPSI
jgi:hypothetical protein